jgi:hypothetical protein
MANFTRFGTTHSNAERFAATRNDSLQYETVQVDFSQQLGERCRDAAPTARRPRWSKGAQEQIRRHGQLGTILNIRSNSRRFGVVRDDSEQRKRCK